MLMCEFLTAVLHKAPVKVIVYNSPGLIFLEAEGVGLPSYREAIQFPNADFAALARGRGHGFKARHPDELPNIPHIELESAAHYAIAKVNEAVIAGNGR